MVRKNYLHYYLRTLKSCILYKPNKIFMSFLSRKSDNMSLVRPEAIAFGADLCFTTQMFYLFIFISPRYLCAASADRSETLQNDRKGILFCNTGPEFWGPSPKKILEAKNMQNLAEFQITLNLDGKYLWNG